MKVDTTILFNKIGDPKLITYEVTSKTGGDYHASTQILIFKLQERVVIGYSIDGCEVTGPLKEIVQTFFIFEKEDIKEQFISFLNSSLAQTSTPHTHRRKNSQ
jgi:hypothetical protein